MLWPIGNAHAALLSPADRSAVQQQQQLLLDQNQRQRDELERSTVLPRTPSSPALPAPDGPCFVISRIVLDGVTVMPQVAENRLTAPWRNQCLDMAALNALTHAVSDWYISRGYITSRAFLTEQDLSHGTLHIAVLEGRQRYQYHRQRDCAERETFASPQRDNRDRFRYATAQYPVGGGRSHPAGRQ